MPGFVAALASVAGMEMESRAKLASEQNEALPSDEIKRRIAEKAALVAELEARNPKRQVGEPSAAPASAPTRRITADGRTLAGLMSQAKKLEDAAIALEERARAARENAKEARGYLDTYLRENGLA